MNEQIETRSTSEQPTRVRYGVMAFLCGLAFLTYYDRVCIMRAQDDIKRDLGLTDAEMGTVFGAFFLAYALFELPSGWLGDKYGARRTLTRIVLAWSFFTVMTGAATGFVMLYASRFLFGVGEAGAFPNMARVQDRWLPRSTRARAGGLLWLLARWGGAFSPLIFGSMLAFFDLGWFRSALSNTPALQAIPSWRMGFFAAGLIGVVWCVLFYFWFRDDPSEKSSVNQEELDLIKEGAVPHSTATGVQPRVWQPLLRSRSLWALATYYICGGIGWSFFISWLPRYLNDEHQIDFKSSELISGLPLLFGGVSCLLGGFASDYLVQITGSKHVGRAICPVCGTLIAALAMLLIPLTGSSTHVVVLMCIASAGFDFGQAANWATMVDIGGQYAGLSTGFLSTVGNLSSAIAPWLGAVIFNQMGWPALFVVYSAMFVLAGTMWLFIDPTRRFYD